jgi:hypothetical protein
MAQILINVSDQAKQELKKIVAKKIIESEVDERITVSSIAREFIDTGIKKNKK